MDNKPKFVLIMLKGLPEKEQSFVGKILDDFKGSRVDCVTLEILSDKSLSLTIQAVFSPYITENEEVDNTECYGEEEDSAKRIILGKQLTDTLDAKIIQSKVSTTLYVKLREGLSVHSLTQALKIVGYELKEGMILTQSPNFNESLLISELTTIVYDQNLESGLPYGIDLIVESFEEVDADFLVKLWKHKNNIPCTIAETGSIIIRELSESDIDEVVKISRQEHVIKFVEDARVAENEQKEKLLAYTENIYSFYDYGIWGIFDKKDSGLIGVISLDLLNSTGEMEYEVGFFIRKERLRLGFAGEALEAVMGYVKNYLPATRLVALTDSENETAIALLEKYGFTVAGKNDKIVFVKNLVD